jgi:beta-lactam-binding protein with PASTA domain
VAPAPTASSEPPSTTTTSEPPSPTTTEPAGITVVASDYVGRDAKAVRDELEGLGLKVKQQKQKDTDADKGTVLAVSEGTFHEGDTLTMIVADPSRPAGKPTSGEPPPTSQPPPDTSPTGGSGDTSTQASGHNDDEDS